MVDGGVLTSRPAPSITEAMPTCWVLMWVMYPPLVQRDLILHCRPGELFRMVDVAGVSPLGLYHLPQFFKRPARGHRLFYKLYAVLMAPLARQLQKASGQLGADLGQVGGAHPLQGVDGSTTSRSCPPRGPKDGPCR